MNQVESFVEMMNWKYCMDWLIEWHFSDKIIIIYFYYYILFYYYIFSQPTSVLLDY